jgi:hypothetical protein
VTEAEARAALRAFVAVGEIEQWIAEQPWQPAPGGGWTVPERFHGCRIWLEPVADGVRVLASMGDGAPAVWVVPVRPERV